MTAFEIAVPMAAVVVALGITAFLRWETKRIDARIAEAERVRRNPGE